MDARIDQTKIPCGKIQTKGSSLLKFVMSYSCGKDSTLALHKMMHLGHEPVGLIIMVNDSVGRSYFHGADVPMLHQYSEALNLPVILCRANEQNYCTAFEEGLKKAKALGAEAACFGDIDIAQNRQWEENRCNASGLVPFFPLWQKGREETVYELVRLGYRCLIKSIHMTVLPKSILGHYIDHDSITVMKSAGIDVCGENGEYHTLTVDGPIFTKPLAFRLGSIMEFGDYAVIDITSG